MINCSAIIKTEYESPTLLELVIIESYKELRLRHKITLTKINGKFELPILRLNPIIKGYLKESLTENNGTQFKLVATFEEGSSDITLSVSIIKESWKQFILNLMTKLKPVVANSRIKGYDSQLNQLSLFERSNTEVVTGSSTSLVELAVIDQLVQSGYLKGKVWLNFQPIITNERT